MQKLKSLVNRGRVAHYVDIFVAAFAMALLYNKENLLGEHGLNALKSVAFAACVAGGKAVFEAYRKSVPAAATAAQSSTK